MSKLRKDDTEQESSEELEIRLKDRINGLIEANNRLVETEREWKNKYREICAELRVVKNGAVITAETDQEAIKLLREKIDQLSKEG